MVLNRSAYTSYQSSMCIPKFSEYYYIYIVIRKPIVWGLRLRISSLSIILMLQALHIMDNGYDQQTVGNVEINCT